MQDLPSLKSAKGAARTANEARNMLRAALRFARVPQKRKGRSGGLKVSKEQRVRARQSGRLARFPLEDEPAHLTTEWHRLLTNGRQEFDVVVTSAYKSMPTITGFPD